MLDDGHKRERGDILSDTEGYANLDWRLTRQLQNTLGSRALWLDFDVQTSSFSSQLLQPDGGVTLINVGCLAL